MPLPTPEAGLVIRYEFLWSHEADAGEEDGSKKRPCAVIVTTKNDQGGTEPATGCGVEIPQRVRQSLGLDNERQWAVLDELNEFIWPGYHIYPIDNSMPVRFDFGFLPPKLFDEIRDKILALKDKQKKINRDG
jgi:hypothetical protein